jgi:cyanophycin synthetase
VARDHPPARRPITRNGKIGFQVENVMAAMAAAWALACPGRPSAAAWPASSTTATTRPGRFNVMDYKGATVIADYGHNPDAMRALVQAGSLPASAAAWSSAAPATAATRTSASRP